MIVELGAAKGKLSQIAKDSSSVHIGNDVFISRVVTHSEEVEAGDLFCVLKGTEDGYAYIQRARERGAAAVLCDRLPPLSIPCLLADNAIKALGRWSFSVRIKSRARCIAVTGSVGKTGTKNALFTIFKDFFSTHATSGNYNNLLGVPLTLLSMPVGCEILICELGTNHIGEIKALSDIVQPNDCIITAIGTAHIEAFGSREGILKEKLGILHGMETGGRLFIPCNEPLFNGKTPGVASVLVSPMAWSDTASAWAVAFAAEVANAYGIPQREIEKRLPSLKAAASRRKEFDISSIHIIDDAYNASWESMLAAFDYLAQTAQGRRLLVLGDMLELGEETPAIHFEVGKAAAKIADLIFLYGGYTGYYQKGIEAAKEEVRVILFEHTSAVRSAKEISAHLEKDDTVLFKAAHAMGAEEICRALVHQLQNQE